MKKITIILAAALVAVSYAGQAQIQSGNVLIGGEISNFNISLNKGGAFSMRIDPKAAWFIRDNVALGGYLGFGLQTATGAGTYTTYGVGALGRVYMNGNGIPTLNHTRLFLEGNVGIEGDNNSFNGVKSSTNGLGLGIGPGLAYFITPSIGLEGLLKYNGILGFGTAVSNSNLNLGIGFQVYLPNKRVMNAAKGKR